LKCPPDKHLCSALAILARNRDQLRVFQLLP
jgi:hypothetical protein